MHFRWAFIAGCPPDCVRAIVSGKMIKIIVDRLLRVTLPPLLSAALFCCTVVPAAAGEEKATIAVILSSSIAPYREALKGYYRELNEKGVEYEAVMFTLGNGMDEDVLLRELRRVNPDVIHTIGTSATKIVKKEFTSTPIVFSMVLNPVASGVVGNMDSPGGNVTGASMDIPVRLQFKMIKRLLPGLKRIGVVYSRDETGVIVADAERVAGSLDVELVKEEVRDAGEVPAALRRLINKVDFLWSVADGNVFTRETIKEFLIVTLQEKLPFMGLSPSFVKAGALVAFKIAPVESGMQAASITEKILRGAEPAAMPVTVPVDIKIVINGSTVDTLGIKVPKDIYRAAEVINPGKGSS